jgi:hypothetical protein
MAPGNAARNDGTTPAGMLVRISLVPLRPGRVVEVRYDHMEGGLFGHAAQFDRWRPIANLDHAPAPSLSSRFPSSLATSLPGSARTLSASADVLSSQLSQSRAARELRQSPKMARWVAGNE